MSMIDAAYNARESIIAATEETEWLTKSEAARLHLTRHSRTYLAGLKEWIERECMAVGGDWHDARIHINKITTEVDSLDYHGLVKAVKKMVKWLRVQQKIRWQDAERIQTRLRAVEVLLVG